MSKLINTYKNLKQEDSDTLYLFKSGIFYIFIADDALKVSKILSLKLTNLNNDTLKCGFPQNSLNKYLNLLDLTPYNIKIIDNSIKTSYQIDQFTLNSKNNELLNLLSTINENDLSIKEAFNFINKIKNIAKEILKEVNTNGKSNK